LDEDSRERRGRIKKEKEEKGEDEGEKFFHDFYLNNKETEAKN